jgi:S-disulfanyl-L-cysteine oxidoreductase SoxD
MFSCRELLLALLLLAAGAAVAQADRFPGVGRSATAREVAAWDIDVRPDFKGLPAGAGSVAKGMQVWESQCASCHGIFGESNQFFSPIVGGTTKDDMQSGRVARLNDASFPGRTTLMKLPTVSTLWDYINRAMPWTQPKSLSVEEVYAVTAYILNLGGVLPDSFVLSDKNIAEVQQRLPNRNGMSTDHALWPGADAGKRMPDVMASACMKNCVKQTKLASFIPDFARDAHGNLAEQNRTVGAQKGADTRRPGAVAAAPVDAVPAAIALLQKHGCVACHGMENKIVGPGFREISRKYAGTGDAVAYLTARIKAGGSGVWGAIAMPPQSLGEADAQVIAHWLVHGVKP